ncbi:hypothetical protein E4U35_000025 [Claviceps purpurea]|nr:hypothetical protein E4U28_006582 [Claviceps purpurea]KAG6174093.1 hypothetical protein E4U51_003310 [Claviceps purpurea]KAG6193976.1 hypothetical protein E4U27_000059 [Claviceps purpurea]KAG6212804.1 hypothetical protein E4U35_000025 [Claviceps purpurea]KAG6225882.1 hypothetical protein E4U34_007478 [Claviceps purpurea]
MPAWVGQTGLGQAWSLEDKIREGGWLAEVECGSALGQPGQRRREKQETKTGNLGENRKKDEENGNGFAWCGDGVRGRSEEISWPCRGFIRKGCKEEGLLGVQDKG